MGIFNWLKNILFPPRCIFCNCFIEPNSHDFFCKNCIGKVEFCSDSICCTKCGKPIESFGKKQLCYFCANEKTTYFNRIISVFVYDGLAKDAVKRFKSMGLMSHTETFTKCLVAQIAEEYGEIKFDFLCGVLANNSKKHNRKDFDQVQLLCERLSIKLGLPYNRKIFVRTRKTQKQSSLGYLERRTNLKDSIRVLSRCNIKDQTVLIIDDVCTTRASIIEYARALKSAGAKKVYAATVATVKNPK